jgi:hypothetical protein
MCPKHLDVLVQPRKQAHDGSESSFEQDLVCSDILTSDI